MQNEHLQDGVGELFNNLDPDKMRAVFRAKNKRLISKITTVSEAVRDLVHDGDYVAIGGFGGVRIPTAVIHEIMRQRKKNLGFSGHVSTHDCQLLSAAECFDRCDAAYVVGLEARGLSPQARNVFQSGKIKVTEWSNGALAWRFKAAAMGVPFVPCRSILGTDTFKYSAAKEMLCPFTGRKLAAIPALYPDVAVLHVHQADVYGNCRIDGILVADDDIAKASKRVIVTTEKLVGTDEFRRSPNRTVIPYWLVDAVIEVPFGSYPGNMPGEYFSDEEHLNEWLEIEKDAVKFQAFLQENIYACRSFAEYLEKNGGLTKLNKLKQQEHLLQ